MTGRQWIVVVVAVVLVAVLYSLPRSVVDNEVNSTIVDEEVTLAKHEFQLPTAIQTTVDSLRNSIFTEEFSKKSSIFADSLVGIYLSYNQLDSAAAYIDWILTKDSSQQSVAYAANRYFQLYGVAANDQQARKFAGKAGSLLEEVVKVTPDPDIQAQLAMTKVVTSNPMEGVTMLRGILEEYPENKTAIYSLGVLSIQSGQYDKAVGRFENLIHLDPSHEQAAYYLAVCYFELGDMEKAGEWFQKIKTESTDPAVLNSAEEYLKKLNEL